MGKARRAAHIKKLCGLLGGLPIEDWWLIKCRVNIVRHRERGLELKLYIAGDVARHVHFKLMTKADRKWEFISRTILRGLLFQIRAKAGIKGVYLSGDIAHNKKTFFIKIPRRKTGDFFSIKDGKSGKRRLFLGKSVCPQM